MSSILSEEALNDFIAPSVACIKPVETLPPPPSSNELSVTRDDDATNESQKTAAQISLTDCLACSGCITSSEAVLVSLQSHDEVLSALQQFPGKRFIALLSPQTRAALAVALNITELEAGNMVMRLLCSEEGIGSQGKRFDAVLDTNPFRQMSLHYAALEALDESTERKKPLLTSSCPGFICYLESTHPELIPHLSNLKSPQAIAGTFLKSIYANSGAFKSPEDIYIVSIMPCFDKKLEGARGELMSGVWSQSSGVEGVRDIDCVITTRELLALAQTRGIDFSCLSRAPLGPSTDGVLEGDQTISNFLTNPTRNGNRDAGTSGGNLIYIINHLVRTHPGSSVQVQQGRNVDTIDYSVVSPSGETIAKMSRCYGFRNIQNLVRRLKPARARQLPRFGKAGVPAKGASRRPTPARASEVKKQQDPMYVEVMACPGGCTNGGGQIKYDDETIFGGLKWVSQKELLGRVDEAYFSSAEEEVEDKMVLTRPDNASTNEDPGQLVEEVVKQWENITGLSKDKLLQTTYRRVENDIGNRLDNETAVLELASRNGGGW